MTAPNWTLIDGGLSSEGLNHHTSRPAHRPTLLGAASGLWAAWSELPEVGNRSSLRIQTYDGALWSPQDDGGPEGLSTNALAAMLSPKLIEHSGQVYLGCLECQSAPGGLARLLTHQAPGDWAEVDQGALNFDPDRPARQLALCSDGTNLYAAWCEESNLGWRLRCGYLDAQGGWSWLDGAGLEGLNSDGENAQHPALAWIHGKLNLVWLEQRGNWGPRSMDWSPQTGWENTDPFDFWNQEPLTNRLHACPPQMQTCSVGIVLALGWRYQKVTQWSGYVFDGSQWNHMNPNLAWTHSQAHPAALSPWGEGSALLVSPQDLQVISNPVALDWQDPKDLGPGFRVQEGAKIGGLALAQWNQGLYALWSESNDLPEQNRATQIRAAQITGL